MNKTNTSKDKFQALFTDKYRELENSYIGDSIDQDIIEMISSKTNQSPEFNLKAKFPFALAASVILFSLYLGINHNNLAVEDSSSLELAMQESQKLENLVLNLKSQEDLNPLTIETTKLYSQIAQIDKEIANQYSGNFSEDILLSLWNKRIAKLGMLQNFYQNGNNLYKI